MSLSDDIMELHEEPPAFDGNAYWLDRGKDYFSETRLTKEYFKEQERLVVDIVSAFAPHSIVELGCGFGRITKRIAESLPETQILACDLSPDQLLHAKENCADLPNVQFQEVDLKQPVGLAHFDMCLAMEVFLHLPEESLKQLIPSILKACPLLIHDFDPDPQDRRSRHIFMHDYLSLYGSLGMNVNIQVKIQQPYGLLIVSAS